MEGGNKQLERLEGFSGKRNAVVTLLVPGDASIIKVLDGIEGRVKGIKHSNKKGQIVRVLEEIRARTGDRKTFGGNGKVLCCGLDNLDKIHYEEVESPHVPVEKEEYFYDYTFHVAKIRELFYADVILRVDESKTLADVQRLALMSSPLLLLGKAEVMKCMEEAPGCINVITLFDGEQKNSDFLNESFVQRLRDTKCVIHRVSSVADETREFVKKFGAIFGHKRY